MYKKISKEEKITRIISEEEQADNYITKTTTKNFSLAVTTLNGEMTITTKNERAYYFINANVDFLIDNEKIHCESKDVLYIDKDTTYTAKGYFEAVTINSPAYGLIK